jgi:carbonic anhydrase
MQKLVEGIHHFQQNIFREQAQLFQNLAKGQAPLTLFITCSDSRINPTALTQTEPGEMFILRTAGNIVPPYGAVWGGEAATVEYAVAVLKVRDIVVCGHSHCGAMAGLLNPASIEGLTAVQALLRHAESTQRIVRENYQHVTDPESLLKVAVEENVLVQLENLRTHPCVAAALSRGDMKLHGWFYKFETGEVFAYDPAEQQFASLGHDVAPLDGRVSRMASI